MEGKEVRFGAAVGGLFMAATTGTSTGAINSWHDSAQPIAGLVPLFNMELGEVTPGGIGAGMYGMLVIGAILAVFIAGLMVGRTPEYLGKKVEAFEIKMAMLVALVLGRQHPRLHRDRERPARGDSPARSIPGPHGFSEILYAFSSQTGNNGSAFAGLTGNTPFYNITGALAMLIGRYGMIVPILALAGSMALKRSVAPSLGTFPTTGRAVGRPPHRRRHHRRRAHVLPGPRAGPDRRAAPPERRKGLLMALLSVDLGRGTRRFQRFVTLGGAKPSRRAAQAARRPRPGPPPVRHPARVPQARSAAPDQEPGHVRRRDHRGPRDGHRHRRCRRRRRRPAPVASGSRSRSGSGCGSPSCSRPTPRRSPRHAVAPRPRPCAGRARRRPPTAAARTGRSRTSARPSCARATSSSSRKARRSPVTATSSRASGSSTRRRSPASPRRSSRSRARTSGARSPAARRWSATASWSRSRPIPGETFLDRMIALVEGAKRQRTPNEIALAILLAGLTIIFLMATVTLRPFGEYAGTTVDTVALIALLVCLIPTTIGGLLSAIGIAGMDRVARFNVLAMSGRAVEASGDVDVILLDKTGTITYGNRLAASITPAAGVSEAEAVEAALVVVDQGRDAGGPLDRRARPQAAGRARPPGRRRRRRRVRARSSATIVEEIPFRAETRTSGVKTTAGTTILKGAVDAIEKKVGDLPAGVVGRRRPDRRPRRHAARPRERGPRPRRHRAQGHRQGRARRALRRVPPDGHPDGDDHRRQPAHRGDDRQGGRRRRLHRAGHARGEDRVHPRRSRPRATSSR